ncbi:MAG: hypothetical protein HY900_33985, partial [Deltaproteobacteria bacterium]|nr:hypothetical protein [Deltaproteobacteria bacterium]
MTGWGREDEELGVRLQNLGRTPFSVANRAVNYHLWHGRANRIPEDYARNTGIKQQYVEGGSVRCPNGYDEAGVRCWDGLSVIGYQSSVKSKTRKKPTTENR